MGKRRRKRRIRRRKIIRGGECGEGRKKYKVEGQNMENVEKINKEEVGDRGKMEVEEGHLTICGGPQWEDCDRSTQSGNIRLFSLRNCHCRFENADLNGWVAPERGVAQRTVFEGNVQARANAHGRFSRRAEIRLRRINIREYFF